MKKNRQKSHWLIDAALFGGFLLALWLDLTGLSVHQWLGIAVGALAGHHLVAHWSWVEAVTGRLFGRTSRQARLLYAIDAGLAIGFLAILTTGLAISTWLGLSLADYAAWRKVHVLVSILTLAFLVAKIGLHWRWIVGTARRHIFPASGLLSHDPAQPVPAAVRVDRRDFVKLMGLVGAAALLAGVNALGGSESTQAGTSSGVQASEEMTTEANASATSTTNSCVVRCQKRCSYPGHCHRYVDTNGNRRCDFGECLS